MVEIRGPDATAGSILILWRKRGIIVPTRPDISIATRRAQPTQEETAKEYVLDFGKYKGTKLINLLGNKGYINYLLYKSDNKEVHRAIELLTGETPLNEEEMDEKLELTKQLMDLIVNKELNVDNELILNRELLDLNQDNYTEDDFTEAAIVLINSIQNSLCDFDLKLTTIFESFEDTNSSN